MKSLQERIAEAQTNLESLQRQLATVQRECSHDWRIEYDPLIKEAYTIAADPPGTMGVDRRVSDVYVPGTEKPQWKRTCPKCHLVERTSRTKLIQNAGVIPGTTSFTEVPDFTSGTEAVKFVLDPLFTLAENPAGTPPWF